MPAPTVNTGSYEVSLASGRYHTAPTVWANIEPFNVSVDSGEYRVWVPTSSLTGEWSSWSSASRSFYGDRTNYAVVVFPGKGGVSPTTQVESTEVAISTLNGGIVLLQLRAVSSGTAGNIVTVTASIGAQDVEWEVQTVPAGWNVGYGFEPTAVSGTTHIIEAGSAVANFYGIAGTSSGTTRYQPVAPGDTIVLKGGTRGKLNIRNLTGTAENPILITNEIGGAKVVLDGTSSHLFQLTDCRHVILDGLQQFSGAVADQVNHGIKVQLSGGSATSGVKLSGLFSDITVRGVEVDGSSSTDTATSIGIAFFGNEASKKLAGNPGEVRENIVYEYCYPHDCSGEGFYIGENRNTDTADPIPYKNLTIRYNETLRTGREGINTKHAVGGTHRVHDNVVRLSGRRAVFNASEEGQKHAMSLLFSYNNIDVYNNRIYDCGHGGIEIRSAAKPSDATTSPAEDPGNMAYTARAWNNLIVRNGVEWSATYTDAPDTGDAAKDDRFGVRVYASALSGRTLTALVANNTIVDSNDSAVKIGTYIDTSVVRDNLFINAQDDIEVHATSSSGHTAAGNISETLANNDTSVVTLYAATGDGDYTVASGSSVIGAASVSTFPTTDLAGETRPFGVASDVGAYERQS